MHVGIGALELLMLLLLSGGGLFSGGSLGLPPGERDAKLIQCAPADSIYYAEWAARSGGREGAAGIDGLAADPEIRLFLETLERAILTAIAEETAGGQPEEQILGRELPPLVKMLLMRPGCVFLRFDPLAQVEGAAAAQEGRTEVWASLVTGLRGALIVNAGNDAETMAAHLQKAIGLLPGVELTEGLQKQPVPLPVPGLSLTLHREKDRVIAALGEGTLDAVLKELEGKGEGLLANAAFRAQYDESRIERLSSLTWVDIASSLRQVTQSLGVQGVVLTAMAKMAGADAIQSVVTCTGLEAGQLRTRGSVRAANSSNGIMALAAGRGLTKSDFQHVPGDADFVAAYSLNLPKLLASIRQVVGQADPRSAEVLETQLKALEEQLGFSLEKDVFKAFGDAWVAYDSPAQGGVLFSGAVLTFEVRDPQTAYSVFTRVMKLLSDSLPGDRDNMFGGRRGVYLAQTKFMDRTVYYVNTVGDDDIPVAPAFCVTDKHLYIALHPQPLKAQLRMLPEQNSRFADRIGADVLLGEGEAIALSYLQTKRLAQLASAVLPYVSQVVLSEVQRNGAPIDIFAIPSPRAYLPYLADAQGTVCRTDKGFQLESRGGLPGSGILLPVLQIPVMFLRLAGAEAILDHAAPAEAIPPDR